MNVSDFAATYLLLNMLCESVCAGNARIVDSLFKTLTVVCVHIKFVEKHEWESWVCF